MPNANIEIKPVEVHDLIQGLQSEDEELCADAAYALGQIGEPVKGAVPALIQALGDKEEFTRHAVVIALGQIGEPAAVPALIQALGDKNQTVRYWAAYALGQIGKPAVPALIQALNKYVRSRAADALDQIGEPAAVPELIQALDQTTNQRLIEREGLWVIKQNTERYGDDDRYPSTILVMGTQEQAEEIAKQLSNHHPGCDYYYYVDEE